MEAEAVQSVIDLCLKVDPESRPDYDRLKSYLTDFYDCKEEERRSQHKPSRTHTRNNSRASLEHFANFEENECVIYGEQ